MQREVRLEKSIGGIGSGARQFGYALHKESEYVHCAVAERQDRGIRRDPGPSSAASL